MVFPLLFIMRRSPLYQPLMKLASIVLAVVSLAWATERIFDYDTSVNSLVDPILRWPRSALVVAPGYLFAIALWSIAKRRNTLEPIVDEVAPPANESEVELDFVNS